MNAANTISHGKILAITLPIILSNATVPLVGIADTFVMGRQSDPAYIAGVALGAAVISMTMLIFGFLRVVTGGYAAQAFGQENWPEFKAIYQRSMVLALGFGLVIVAMSPVLIWLAEWVFREPDFTETIMAQYLQIRLMSAPLTLINMVIVGMLVAEQRTGLMFGLQLLLNLTNIALNLLFVLELEWGVQGLALASVTAELLAVVLGLGWLSRRLAPISLKQVEVWSWAKFKPLLSANANIVIRNIALDGCFFLMVWYAGFFGTVVLAANAIHIQFVHLSANALDGFAFSIETLCGSAYGRKNKAQFRDVIAKTSLWAGLLSLIIAIVYYLAGSTFFDFMTISPEVRQAGMATLWVVALSPLVGVWAFQADGIFFGTTETAALRNATLASAIVFNIMVLLLWPLGVTGLWIAFMGFFVARTLFLAAHYPMVERKMD